jgi:hypothetical protein
VVVTAAQVALGVVPAADRLGAAMVLGGFPPVLPLAAPGDRHGALARHLQHGLPRADGGRPARRRRGARAHFAAGASPLPHAERNA